MAGLAGSKNMWRCVFENGNIMSLFKHNINPVSFCSLYNKDCVFQSLCG